MSPFLLLAVVGLLGGLTVVVLVCLTACPLLPAACSGGPQHTDRREAELWSALLKEEEAQWLLCSESVVASESADEEGGGGRGRGGGQGDRGAGKGMGWRGTLHAIKCKAVEQAGLMSRREDGNQQEGDVETSVAVGVDEGEEQHVLRGFVRRSWTEIVWAALVVEHPILALWGGHFAGVMTGLRLGYAVVVLWLSVAVLVCLVLAMDVFVPSSVVHPGWLVLAALLLWESTVRIPLHTLLLRVCSARRSGLMFVDNMFAQRDHLLRAPLSGMTVPELASFEVQMEALYCVCEREQTLVWQPSHDRQAIAAFDKDIFNQVQRKQRQATVALRRVRADAESMCDQLLQNTADTDATRERLKAGWHQKMDEECRLQQRLDLMGFAQREVFLVDQLFQLHLFETPGVAGALKARLYRAFAQDRSWSTNFTDHLPLKQQAQTVFAALSVVSVAGIAACTLSRGAPDRVLLLCAVTWLVDMLLIAPAAILVTRVLLPWGTMQVLAPLWYRQAKEVEDYVTSSILSFGYLNVAPLATLLDNPVNAEPGSFRLSLSTAAEPAKGGGGDPQSTNARADRRFQRSRAGSLLSVYSEATNPYAVTAAALDAARGSGRVVSCRFDEQDSTYMSQRPENAMPLHSLLLRNGDLVTRLSDCCGARTVRSCPQCVFFWPRQQRVLSIASRAAVLDKANQQNLDANTLVITALTGDADRDDGTGVVGRNDRNESFMLDPVAGNPTNRGGASRSVVDRRVSAVSVTGTSDGTEAGPRAGLNGAQQHARIVLQFVMMQALASGGGRSRGRGSSALSPGRGSSASEGSRGSGSTPRRSRKTTAPMVLGWVSGAEMVDSVRVDPTQQQQQQQQDRQDPQQLHDGGQTQHQRKSSASQVQHHRSRSSGNLIPPPPTASPFRKKRMDSIDRGMV